MTDQERIAEETIRAADELVSAGNGDAARQLLETLVESRTPGYAKAVIPLGLLYERSGAQQEAAGVYRIGIASEHPTEGPQAAINLGCLLLDDLHDPVAARASFERALAFGNPDIALAAGNNLARIAQLEGDLGAARREYRQVADSGHPDHAPWAMLQLALLLEPEGNVTEARNWYQAALATSHPLVARDAQAALVRLGAGPTHHA